MKSTYTLIAGGFVLTTFFLILACRTSPTPSEAVAVPVYDNVLLIISDDLANHAVASYGNTMVKTPNIDRLTVEGVRFSRAYANAPMCTPSRATILTGRYPHATGVTLLFTPLPDSVTTLAEQLGANGFATGIFGKTHFNGPLKHGFDTLVNNREHQDYLATLPPENLPDTVSVRPEWKPFRDPARIWLNAEGATSGNRLAHSRGTFFANATIDFMRINRDRRFFAVASFNEPHSPFNFPVEYQGRFKNADIDLPIPAEEDARWVPAVFKDLTEEEKRGIIRSYYTSVEYMDYNVGLLLNALQELKLEKNTLVIFVGDHGYLLHHHGRFEKHMMWEEAVKTPLIVRGFVPEKVIDTPVELADLAPTITAATGVADLPQQHGKSLLPLLRGATSEHKPYIFSEYQTDDKAMITDGRWKYIFTSGKRDLGSGYETGHGPSGVLHRLYDLQNDPQERRNVAGLPESQAILGALQQALLQRFRETHPKAKEISPDLSVEEQLARFCEAVEGAYKNQK